MTTLAVETSNQFETLVLKNDKLVLVDFWADWCAPCHAMAPILENIAEKMKDDIVVVKLNVESSADNSRIAGEYQVQGIPNMQVFKNGKVIETLVGVRPQQVLEQELEKHITSN